MAELGWLMIELNSTIPNIPRLETVNVLPSIRWGNVFFFLCQVSYIPPIWDKLICICEILAQEQLNRLLQLQQLQYLRGD
jgi:hypothetical protein